MEHIPVLIGVGAAAFASTDIDDLVILIGFFADPSYRPRQVVIGQFAGIMALILVSLFGAVLARAVPDYVTGLLGLVPIGIGVKKLVFAESDEGVGEGARRLTRNAAKIATVMSVTIANGGDNLSLYVPLFSVHDGGEIAVLVMAFLTMTGLWCAAGYMLATSGRFSDPVQRWGRDILPYALVALGLYIIAKSGVLALIG